MPGKKVQCTSCLKVMRSDNLKRHARLCSRISTTVSGKQSVEETPHYPSSVKQKRENIPTFDGDEFCGKKIKSCQTINKIMQICAVTEDHQDKIATKIMQELKTKRDVDREKIDVLKSQTRFNTLICEFTKHQKLENRNELNLLIKEMLAQDLITYDEYEQLKRCCKLSNISLLLFSSLMDSFICM